MRTDPISIPVRRRWLLATLTLISSVLLSMGVAENAATAQTVTIPLQIQWISGFSLLRPDASQPARAWQRTDIVQSVNIRRFGNYVGNPTLELTGGPAGLRIVPLSNPVGASRLSFVLHADDSTPAGLYNTRLKGTGRGNTNSIAFPIYVGVPGAHTIALVDGLASAAPGQIADVVFEITPTETSTIPDVDLVVALPSGWNFIQVQSENRVWVRITVPSSAAPGVKALRVSSWSGVHSSQLDFTIQVL
jgi:hypothetical protein